MFPLKSTGKGAHALLILDMPSLKDLSRMPRLWHFQLRIIHTLCLQDAFAHLLRW